MFLSGLVLTRLFGRRTSDPDQSWNSREQRDRQSHAPIFMDGPTFDRGNRFNCVKKIVLKLIHLVNDFFINIEWGLWTCPSEVEVQIGSLSFTPGFHILGLQPRAL